MTVFNSAIIRDPGRLAALRATALLDTPSEDAFDRLARLAAKHLGTTGALVTLVDEDRQFFKSCLGLPEPWNSWRQTPLSHSFCQHVVATAEPLVINDTRAHPLFKDNPAIKDLGVVAYLGIPLITSDKHALGSFCVVDSVPRMWTVEQIAVLRDFSSLVMDEIGYRSEIRRRTRAEAELERHREDLEARIGTAKAELEHIVAEMRESEEQLRVIVESATDAIITIDQKNKIHFANRAAETTFGYSVREMFGQELTMLMPDNLRHLHRAGIERYLRTGKRHLQWDAVSITGLHKNGHEIPLEISFGEFERDGTRFFTGILRDVTHRKQIERSAALAGERLGMALEASGLSLWDCDIATGRIYLSEGFSVMLGGESKETNATVQELEQMAHPDDIAVVRSLLLDTIKGKIPGYREAHRLRNSRGEWIWIESTGKVVERDKDGRARRMIGTNVDVTERKRAEEMLRRSEEDYRSLVQGAAFGIYRSTATGRFLAVNAALVEMLGYGSTTELMKLDIPRDLYVDSQAREELIKKYPSAGQADSAEVEWKRKDGRVITVRLNWRMVHGPRGQPLFFEGIAENVTERRLLQEQLRQSQKMEAVGQLAGGIAHDFNNLLTVIMGYTELSTGRLEENDPERENVKKVLHAARRAVSLTQQLLAFSRKQVLSPKVLDLNSFVAETGKILPRLLHENIEITIATSAQAERINVDPGQLSQVIINLVINARDAMPHGGKLLIETARVEVDDQHQGLVPRGHYAVITVQDTGIGMDAETQSHIFEPFFTTKDPGKGTGLGLSTVYGIIKQSNGHIFVNSKVREGTSFTIYLPSAGENMQISPLDRPADVPLAQGSETILLVEDESNVRAVARMFLEMQGYVVLEAEDTLRAVQIAQERSGPINLLLSDVIMPAMSGPELATQLRVYHPEMKVLYISGYTDDAIAHHGVLQEGIFLLQKPFTRETLADVVRKVLDSPSESLTGLT